MKNVATLSTSNNICYFCGINKSIENSHIIPNYFFKWLKKNCFTGFMRANINNYRRIQDGIKLPLLCHHCEEEFSKYEKFFKENVFDKITEYQDKILIAPESKKFIYSLIWRVIAMHYYFKEYHETLFNENEYNRIPDFLGAIKCAYNLETQSYIKTHVLPINDRTENSIFIENQNPFNKALYMQRAIGLDFYPWEDERYFITIIKLPLFVVICEMNNKNTWRDVQIEYVTEIFFNKTYKLPDYIYWLLRMEYGVYCKAASNKMSEKDNAKIQEMISKNRINKNAIESTGKLLKNLKNHKN